jgi:O-antigen ligase
MLSRTRHPSVFHELLAGVRWSPELIGLIYFVVAITTFYLPWPGAGTALALMALLPRLAEWRLPPSARWLAALVSWALLSAILSAYQKEAIDQWIEIAKLFLIFVLIANSIRSTGDFRILGVAAVGAFLLFPFRGAVFNYAGGNTTFGRAIWNYAYSNPNDLATIAILFAFIAFAVASCSRARATRWAMFASGGALLMLVFFTQSRGALLGLAVPVPFLFWQSKRKLRLLAFATFAAGSVALVAPQSVWDRLSGLSNVSLEGGMRGVDQEGSAEQRFQILQIAMSIAQDHALFGTGPGVYHLYHLQYAPSLRDKAPTAFGARDAHNTYVRLLAELGVPGLLLFVAFVGSMLRSLNSQRKGAPESIGARASAWLFYGLIAYLVAGLFGSYAYVNYLYVFLSLCGSLLLLFRPRPVLQVRRGRSKAASLTRPA